MLIAQLSDFHLRPRGRACYRVVETNALTERACRAVGAFRPAPDLVLITGDLTEDGSEEEYALLHEILRRTLSHLPVFVIPGNHDRREVMLAQLDAMMLPDRAGPRRTDGFIQYAIEDFPVRIVMLDTVVPGEPHGILTAAQLAWLDRTLAERPDRPTLIGMHHPPFVCGLGNMDGINLREADRFAAVLARHEQVQRIICGHHHRPITASFGHAIASICPSVAHQTELDLSPDAPSAFLLEPPQFQLHLWSPSHGFVTHTAMVERFPGPYPFGVQE